MRALLLASAALIVLPVPALAQDESADTHRVARQLHDPVNQSVATAATEAMANSVLDTPIAPLLRATRELSGEDPRDVPPDLRLGDILPPEAADAPHRFARELPRKMDAMADMSDAIADLTAHFAALGEAVRAAAGPAYRR